MTKQLFLTSAASPLGGAGNLAASTSRGGASVNAVTNTVTSGTNIQATDTAGGNALSWWFKLGPCQISGNVTANIRGLESALTANAGAGLLIEHYDPTGVTLLSTVLTDRTVPSTITEYTTADAAKALASVAPTSTAIGAGDWLKITVKVRNVGTMSHAAGETVTNSYNGPTAAVAGDSSVTFADNLPSYISGILGIGHASTAVGSNAAPLTASITLPAGTGLMVVDVSLGFNPDTATFVVDYGGTLMTSMGPPVHSDNVTSGYIQRFKLQAPTTGSALTLTVKPSAGTGLTILANWTYGTWTDANNLVSAFGAGATAAVTLTSAVGRQCLASATGGQAYTSFAGFPSQQLILNNVNTSSAAGNMATAIGDGATSVAFNNAVMGASDDWAIIACDLVSSTSISLADTGSGADAVTVAATVTLAETGTGTDVIASTPAVTLADVGSGADAIAVTIPQALADTGTGTDALAATAAVPLGETGSGADAVSVNVPVPLSDSGAGLDAISASPSDTLSDTGHGTDALSASAALTLADAGSAVDAATTSAAVQLADTGTGVDALSVAGGSTPVTLADAGSAADALALTSISATLAETGSAVDAITEAVTVPTQADTGQGADALSVALAAALADTGHATDAMTTSSSVTLADGSSIAETFAVMVTTTLADVGHTADAIIVNPVVPLVVGSMAGGLTPQPSIQKGVEGQPAMSRGTGTSPEMRPGTGSVPSMKGNP